MPHFNYFPLKLPEIDKTPVRPGSFSVGRDLSYTLIADGRVVGALGFIDKIERKLVNLIDSSHYLITLYFARQGGTDETLDGLLAAKYIGLSETWRNQDQSVDSYSYLHGRVVSLDFGTAEGVDVVLGHIGIEFANRERVTLT